METQRTSLSALLKGYQFMNLFTFRKSGVAVKTPVWFAVEDETIYVMTGASAGKVKRIRNNAQVRLGPGDARGVALGPELTAYARILAGSEAEIANRALDRKYGVQKAMFDLAARLQGRLGSRAFLAITANPPTSPIL